MARWAPIAAAAAVVAVVGGTGAFLATRPAAPAAAAATDRPALAELRVHDGDLVTASGTVLAVPGEPPLVTTLLDLGTAEKQLREHYDGNLCVRPALRSRAALDAVWNRVQAGADWTRYGVFEGSPGYLAGRVLNRLMVLDDAAYGWLAAAGGDAIDARPWLLPA